MSRRGGGEGADRPTRVEVGSDGERLEPGQALDEMMSHGDEPPEWFKKGAIGATLIVAVILFARLVLWLLGIPWPL